MANGEAEQKPGNKRLSVERIYQKKSQLEHILLRPDTYIGTVERLEQVSRVCCVTGISAVCVCLSVCVCVCVTFSFSFIVSCEDGSECCKEW